MQAVRLNWVKPMVNFEGNSIAFIIISYSYLCFEIAFPKELMQNLSSFGENGQKLNCIRWLLCKLAIFAFYSSFENIFAKNQRNIKKLVRSEKIFSRATFLAQFQLSSSKRSEVRAVRS